MLKNFFGRTLDQIAKSAAMIFIQVYRVTLSPFLGGNCRFYPSCSEYGIDAYKTHSFTQATTLTARRLLKCHPLGPHGYDPIPGKENS